MLYYICTLLFIAGVILGRLIRKTEYKTKAVHYDSSGVASNPPNVFELTAKKTFNFKVTDKHILSLPQVSAGEGLIALSRIQILYGGLVKIIEASEKAETEPDQKTVIKLSLAIAGVIYLLCKPYSKGGWRLRRAFFARCLDDVSFLMQITQELIDFWVKKKRLMVQMSGAQPSIRTDGGLVYSAILSSQVKPSFTMSPTG